MQMNPQSKGQPTYVQGLEENRANCLGVGANYAFVIGRSFEAPMSSRNQSPVKSLRLNSSQKKQSSPKINSGRQQKSPRSKQAKKK